MGRTYVALDTEATGLRADSDEIIEVGAVKFRDGQVLDRWESFIRPSQPIPHKIQVLTGISAADVQGAPTLYKMAPALLRFLGDCYIVGHSIDIDLQLLARQGVRTHQRAYDTFELATLLVPDLPVYTLVGVAQALGVATPVQHRALADAELAMYVFEALVGRLGELPIEVLAEINQATAASEWPLRFLFQEVEREAARRPWERTSASVRSRLQAAGLTQAELDLGLIHAPVPPPSLDPPAATPVPLDMDALAAALQPGGALSAVLPTYEPRPQQADLARAIGGALDKGEHLLVEAGSGTGKTLAYLLPAIAYARQNNCRVVIATSSASLQAQLLGQDIPLLQGALEAVAPPAAPVDPWTQALATAQLGRKRERSRAANPAPAPEPPFRAAVLRDRGDYLCLRRWARFRKRTPATLDELRMLVKVLIWLPRTTTGNRSELLLINEEAAVWGGLAVSDEGCPVDECQYAQKGLCFHYRARQGAEAAHVVLVDHALLLADMAARHTLLPPYRHLIVDEAHLLETAATGQLGYKLDAAAITAHVQAMCAPSEDSRSGCAAEVCGLLAAPPPLQALGGTATSVQPAATPPALRAAAEATLGRLEAACTATRQGIDDLFARLHACLDAHSPDHNEYDKRLRLTAAIRRQPAWGEAVLCWREVRGTWQTALDELAGLGALVEDVDEISSALHSALLELHTHWQTGTQLYRQLDAALDHPSEGAIYWLGSNAREGTVVLHSAPLQVGDLLDRHLFRGLASAVLVSSTLSPDGDFSFVREQLHLHQAQEWHGAPATPAESVLLYVPDDLPEPNHAGYQHALEEALIALGRATGGGLLILFTSHNALRTTYRAIARPLEDAGLLVLGHNLDGSRRQLLDRFRHNPQAILLGTASFWDGMDRLGTALRVLAIPKLPFPVPNDPIFAARSEQCDDPFNQYALPHTLLRLRQGVAPLFPHPPRRTAIALLDRRVLSKAYGSTILQALPPCTMQTGPAHGLGAAVGRWVGVGEDQ